MGFLFIPRISLTPVSLSSFHRDSNSTEISFKSFPNGNKFITIAECTCTVVTFAKCRSNWICKNHTKQNVTSIELKYASEERSVRCDPHSELASVNSVQSNGCCWWLTSRLHHTEWNDWQRYKMRKYKIQSCVYGIRTYHLCSKCKFYWNLCKHNPLLNVRYDNNFKSEISECFMLQIKLV